MWSQVPILLGFFLPSVTLCLSDWHKKNIAVESLKGVSIGGKEAYIYTFVYLLMGSTFNGALGTHRKGTVGKGEINKKKIARMLAKSRTCSVSRFASEIYPLRTTTLKSELNRTAV